jgi:hypothetical protein
MVDRVRVPAATRLAGPLLERALDQLPADTATAEVAGR